MLVAGTGCAPRSFDRPLSEWLAEDADSCLRVYTSLYPALCAEKQYDSLERTYTRLLRSMANVPGAVPTRSILRDGSFPTTTTR